MNSAYGITAANLMRTFPPVLAKDSSLQSLASSISALLETRVEEISRLRIYTRIDELPEDLLDILAYDFKVDWYGYNYVLEAKRALIKGSFNVHRHLGSRGATGRALSDIYPDADVEEWFEYGGDPYFFRVILDVTNQRIAIIHSDIVRTLDIYKSLRSHLQDDKIIYRSRTNIGIVVATGYVLYGVRLCGTFPVTATQGAITNEDIAVLTDGRGAIYTVPMSGAINAGSYPVIATQGDIETGGIDVSTDGGGVAYSARLCGTAPGSII